MKSSQKGFSAVGILIIAVVGLTGAVIWLVWDKNKSDNSISNNSTSSISNFQECKDAGYPIAESYPEQCSANGQTFVNTTKQPGL